MPVASSPSRKRTPRQVLDENFDTGNGGFTIAVPNLGTGTEWTWGVPNSSDQSGGAVTADHEGTGRCWGTNPICIISVQKPAPAARAGLALERRA